MTAGTEFARLGRRLAILTVLAVSVSGCGALGLLGGKSGPPPVVYEISTARAFKPEAPRVSWQLVVAEPYAASAINTDRIAARTGTYQYAYYSGVRWSDRAPRMVQTRLVASFENSGKITAVGRQAIGLRSDYELKSDLREFQVYLPGRKDGRPLVWVQMNLKLVKQPSAQIIASVTVDGRAYAASDSMGPIVSAFDEALGKVTQAAVTWTLRTGQEHYRRTGPHRLSEPSR